MRYPEYGRPDFPVPSFTEEPESLAGPTRMAGQRFSGLESLEFPAPIKLDPGQLDIPVPGAAFKQNPRYLPTVLPGVIQKEILNPGTYGAAGFGVS